MNRLLFTIALIALSFSCSNDLSAAERNSAFEKILVKNQAERYEQNGGVSSSGHELYVYSNDTAIQNSIADAQSSVDSTTGLNIASPTIDKKSRIRRVHIVVDAQKGIKINRKRLGIDKRAISIANPTTEEGARVKKVNILVDAKLGGVAVE